MQGDSPGPVARVEGALGRLLAEPGRGRALYAVGLLAFTLIVWLMGSLACSRRVCCRGWRKPPARLFFAAQATLPMP